MRWLMDLLFVGVGWTDLAITLNRIAVGHFLCCRDIISCSTQSATVQSSMNSRRSAFRQWASINGGNNSDYKTLDDAKRAISRYFQECNMHFKQHPRRAGNKIWRKEREPSAFSETRTIARTRTTTADAFSTAPAPDSYPQSDGGELCGNFLQNTRPVRMATGTSTLS